MKKQFYCNICELSFESGYGLASHLRSKEHRDRLNFGTDSVVEKFLRGVKAAIDPNKDAKG